jgi:hypothetical protein
MRRLRPWLAGLACLLASHAAWADRSRLEDESDIAEAGECAAEWALERQREGAATAQETALELDCGIGWRTELLAAFGRQRSAGERAEAIALEALTSLRDRADGIVGWALVWGLARERAGTGDWRSAEHFVAIELTWHPDPGWLLQARLGTLRDRLERRDATPWALTLEHGLRDGVEVAAELEGDDRRRPMAGVMLRFELGHEDLSVLSSYATSLGAPRERRVGLALGIDF